jgi:hypothetical protein
MPPKAALGVYRGTNLSALRAMAAAEANQESTIPEEVEQSQPARGHSSLVNEHRGAASNRGRSVRSEKPEATYKINGEFVENPEDIIAEYRRRELNYPAPPTEDPPKFKSPRTSRRSEPQTEAIEEPVAMRNSPKVDYEEESAIPPTKSIRSARFTDTHVPTVEEEYAPRMSAKKTSVSAAVERRPLNEFVEEQTVQPSASRFMQSPRSPPMSGKIPVEEYEVKRTYTAASPSTKIPTTIEEAPPIKTPNRATSTKRKDELESLNSKQLRDIIRKLQDDKTSRRTRTETPREEPVVAPKPQIQSASPMEEKIPMWDEDAKRWVLINKSKIEEMQQGMGGQQTRTNVTAPQQDEGAGGELDFDNMTAIQQREFNDEMRVKFNILRRGYPQFGIPEVTGEDDPRWLWGMYQQFLDMAKHESSLPFYRNGMTIFFFLTDALLSYLGIPCNGEFYKFHNSYFSDYNSLLIELGESWGPVMDVSWKTETKLALMIGWNTMVFVVMKFITTKFGDKFAGVMESFVKNLNAKDFIQGTNESSILSKAKDKMATEASGGADANPMGNVMGNLMSMFGGMMGGNGGASGGNNKMMEGLLSGLGSMMTAQTDGASRQRRRPDFDDV